jgi:mannosyltransferase OCH1-like enzyme
MNSWRKFVPEYGYYFYTDEMCDVFMKNEMSQEFDQIYTAYKKLPVAVMKADLWRYCILYKYGGIYADVDAICKCDPNTFTCNPSMLVLAPENSTHLCQWCFAACAGSPILKQIIELSIQRILTVTSFKKPHIIHYLTGPCVFTDGIEKYLVSQNMRIFEDKKKYYVYKNSGMICFKYEVFHTILIHHLFTGQDKDGWCNQIQQLM